MKKEHTKVISYYIHEYPDSIDIYLLMSNNSVVKIIVEPHENDIESGSSYYFIYPSKDHAYCKQAFEDIFIEEPYIL